MSDWQPIETAPKDGRDIIYRRWDGEVSVCRWDTMDELNFEPCWYDPQRDADVEPTYWIPLPELPTESES